MTTAGVGGQGAQQRFIRPLAGLALALSLVAALVAAPTAAQAAVPPGGGVVNPPTSYVLSVPSNLQKQSNGYYCVPASLRAALQFDGVSSPPSQATLAGEIGTTSSGTYFSYLLPEALNKRQNKNDYYHVQKEDFTQSDLISKMKRTIGILKTATVVGGTPYGTLPWWPSTDPSRPTGHAVVVYGYDASSVNIFDPLDGTRHKATYAQFTKFVNAKTQTNGVNWNDDIVY